MVFTIFWLTLRKKRFTYRLVILSVTVFSNQFQKLKIRGYFMHYYHDFSNGIRISLVGSVITIYSFGRKIRQYFYSSHKNAKMVFMSLV